MSLLCPKYPNIEFSVQRKTSKLFQEFKFSKSARPDNISKWYKWVFSGDLYTILPNRSRWLTYCQYCQKYSGQLQTSQQVKRWQKYPGQQVKSDKSIPANYISVVKPWNILCATQFWNIWAPTIVIQYSLALDLARHNQYNIKSNGFC